MKLSFKIVACRLAAGLAGSICLVSCGNMGPDFMAGASPASSPVVRLAGDGQVAGTRSGPVGSYLVMFREQSYSENLFFASFADEFAHHYSRLSEDYLADSRIKNIDVLTSVDMSGLRSVDWEPEFSLPQAISSLTAGFSEDTPAGVLTRVDFESDDAARSMLSEWESDGRIWFAEPNESSKMFAGELAQWGTDYGNMQQWHKTIKLPDAFNSLAGGKVKGAAAESNLLVSGPIVAVLDSGVDYEHPQLKDNIWVNSAVGAAGCAGDLHGCNTTVSSKGSLGNGEVWPVVASGPGESCVKTEGQDKCDHGTHVAGIIAAKPDTSTSVGGVCPVCKIMILRVGEVEAGDTSGDPTIRDDSQVRAFKYITRFTKSGGSAVRIVNASFGKYSRSRSLAILVDVLKRVGTGTVVIGAASNEDSMIRAYPAALANAVAVSSIGTASDANSLQKSPFSNYGPWVDIAAPGYKLISTLSGGTNSGPKSGTSMAAPVVAGAAGLLLSAFPNLGFSELRDRILTTANASLLYGSDTEGGKSNSQYYYPKVSGETARRPLLGGGVVDVNAMINNAKNTSTGQPLDRVTAGCGTIGAGQTSTGGIWLIVVLFLPMAVGIIRRRWS